jgi:hypothetical protein
MISMARSVYVFFLLLTELRCADGQDGPKREVLVKEVVLDSAVVDIVYLGKDHRSVLLTTKSKRLYNSFDGGQNWQEATDKVATGEVQVEQILVSPVDKDVCVLKVTRKAANGKRYPYMYTSENAGKAWKRVWGNKQAMHSWIFHPTQRTWALVSFWTGDCDGSAAKAAKTDDDKKKVEPCVHRLMMTRDLGKTFLPIVNYVVQFSWGSGSVDQANRVYFTSYRQQSGDQGRLSLWTKQVDFAHMDLSSRGRPSGSVTKDLEHGNKFLVSNEFILVAQVKDEVQQNVWLMVSKDGAKTWKASLLPSGMGELEEKWYTILDTSEGAVFLHINSATEGSKDSGTVFISDSEGYKYSQSLADNVRSSHGDCEFDKVLGLDGIYMANIVLPNTAGTGQSKEEKAAEDQEKEAADGSAVDKKHGKTRTAKPAKNEKTVRSVISFDKGGVWSYLKPPRVDSLGKAYECAGKSRGLLLASPRDHFL